jgi:glycosyltransferase involved in cell wall biosynthesis
LHSVCHLTSPGAIGGLETVVHRLAVQQQGLGYAVRVIAVVDPTTEDTPFLAALRDAEIRTDVLRIGSRAYLSELRQVRATLTRDPVEIVHTHGYRSDLLHHQTARALGIPIVTTIHGSSRLGGLSHLFEWLQLRHVRRFDGIATVSKPLFDTLRTLGAPDEALRLVPNAWPIGVGRPLLEQEAARRALRIPAADFIIGWIGRIVAVKGCDIFIDALTRLPGGWHAVIIGDGPDRRVMESAAAARGLAGRITFTGEVPDAGRYMRAFDAFVLSSRSEGTPMVLFEAMEAGVPIIASAVGGVPDVVGAASLVPAADPPALTRALAAFHQDVARRDAMADAARERLMTEYSGDLWAERYEELYTVALASNQRLTPAHVQ